METQLLYILIFSHASDVTLNGSVSQSFNLFGPEQHVEDNPKASFI